MFHCADNYLRLNLQNLKTNNHEMLSIAQKALIWLSCWTDSEPDVALQHSNLIVGTSRRFTDGQ